MLKTNRRLILLFLILLITSCKKNVNSISLDNDQFLYPLEVGNSWEYDRQFSTFNYRSIDSLNYPRYDDSIHYYSKITVEVVRKETILDSVETSVIQSLETSSSMETFGGEKYYKNQTEGLYTYAYNMYGVGGNGLPKRSNSEKIIFKGREFNSVYEIIQSLDLISPNLYKISSDSIHYENPPVKILEYPLEISNEWIMRPAGYQITISKRMVGKEIIRLSSRVFLCNKIEWLYDLDKNNQWDVDISVIDFIADEGLIKRTMLIKDLVISTAESPKGNGYCDWSEKIMLTNTNL